MNATSELTVDPANPSLLEAPVAWRVPAGVALRFACLYFPGFLVAMVVNADGPSSDTAAMYRFLAWVLAVSAGGAMLWSVLDRRQSSLPVAHRALEVFLRGTLFLAVASYGVDKVFKSQFPFPDELTLSTPIGQLPPIALLWAFMGYSTVYTVFAGLVELLGAVLLVFRRTRTLGALLVSAAMTNVVMLNVGYDVCVKVFSIHLLLMAVILLAPDVRRLADFFFLNRPIASTPVPARGPWARRLVMGTKGAALLLVLAGLVALGVRSSMRAEAGTGTSFPEGLYEVDGSSPLAAAGDAQQGSQRWKRIVFRKRGLMLQRESGDPAFYRLVGTEQRPSGGAVTVAPMGEANAASVVLQWRLEGGDVLVLDGVLDGHPLSFRGRHVPLSSFPLVTHGTHWVKEGFD